MEDEGEKGGEGDIPAGGDCGDDDEGEGEREVDHADAQEE